MTLVIRPEQPDDYAAIAEVNRLAFGQDDEARLVAALRRSEDFIPELSLVAARGDRLVGYILFTRIVIRGEEADVESLALAPLAVRPECQKRGVGSALVQHGLEACRRAGHGSVVVLGHAEYYPRFGFVPAAPKGIRAPFPVPEEAFMVVELVPGALAGLTGTVVYPPAFSGV